VGADEFQSGLSNLRNAKLMAEKYGDKLLECEARRWLSLGLIRDGQYCDEGISEATEVLKIQSEIGDRRGIMDIKKIIAAAFWKEWEPHEALKLYDEIQEYAEDAFDNELMIMAMGNSALCQIALDEDPLSSADPLLRKVEERAGQSLMQEGLASALLHRGYLRVCVCNWADAIEYLSKATYAYLKCGNREFAGYSLVLVGWAQLRAGSIEDAKATYENICRDRLVPRGDRRVDFQVLAYALEHGPALREDRLADVVAKFKDDHEQRFQLLLLMLETVCQRVDRKAIEAVASAARDAAVKSGFRVFQTVLRKTLGPYDLEFRE